MIIEATPNSVSGNVIDQLIESGRIVDTFNEGNGHYGYEYNNGLCIEFGTVDLPDIPADGTATADISLHYHMPHYTVQLTQLARSSTSFPTSSPSYIPSLTTPYTFTIHLTNPAQSSQTYSLSYLVLGILQ